MQLQMDRSEELIDSLMKTAQQRVSYHNYLINKEVEEELKNFITSGIKRLSQSQLRDTATLRIATRNINDLVDLMYRNSRSRRLNETLDVSSLNYAMRAFCPRFPFC
jgi:hypothetical protein